MHYFYIIFVSGTCVKYVLEYLRGPQYYSSGVRYVDMWNRSHYDGGLILSVAVCACDCYFACASGNHHLCGSPTGDFSCLLKAENIQINSKYNKNNQTTDFSCLLKAENTQINSKYNKNNQTTDFSCLLKAENIQKQLKTLIYYETYDFLYKYRLNINTYIQNINIG